MADFLIATISILADLIIWIVIIDSLLSYFISPYHPVKQSLDRIVEPMLMPIRQFIPPIGMFDFSPLILIILLQVLRTVLINLLT